MTQYERGRAKEWAVCKELRARGWQAVRSAGSHGYWDISAVDPKGVPYVIQVKYTRDGHFRDYNLQCLERMKFRGIKQVWVYTYGNKEPEVFPC